MSKKRWGWELEEAHKENLVLINSIQRTLSIQWKNDGFPKEPSETSKHMWIVVSGCLERCYENLRGKNLD